MPLIVYLHGGGGVYNLLNNTEIAQVVKRHYNNDFPFILLVPFKNKRDWYLMGNGTGYKILADLTNEIINEYKTNKNKTILTGCSDGGLATWQFAADYPEMFSAIVPVSGAGYHYIDNRLEVFKNEKIRGVVSSDSYDGHFKECMTNYCKEIVKYGGYCTLEEIKGLMHSTIVTGDTVDGKFIEGAYSKEMFEWMLKQ
jgi:predicted peptidase